ncbi:hypothetical protein FB45DRAFT_899321 [Roridomyces roridus]|uniref:Uncharacterized protein n=1 Tax=Roridomyces roridus TaxID=1738132 RepID=A0AAD7C6R5_9AGAR|nr:hypothetical protein FB45DRAFT_899321 [Roridomyces roridus]
MAITGALAHKEHPRSYKIRRTRIPLAVATCRSQLAPQLQYKWSATLRSILPIFTPLHSPMYTLMPAHHQRMGHVNTMADTVLINASAEDLRAILRSMLASKTPGLVSAFLTSTRTRLHQRTPSAALHSKNLQTLLPFDFEAGVLAPQLQETLTRARLLYGSGLGFDSLPLLTAVVRATMGVRWPAEGEVPHALVVVDADLDQALQSCREELQGDGPSDYSTAQNAVMDLADTLESIRLDVEQWGGEFPFERAIFSVRDLKL